jgi:P27 family predicted phage terminase small subunit
VGHAWLSPTTDLDVLTRLCQAHDEREQLRAHVAKHGHVIELPTGELRGNPSVTQLRKLEELITRYEGVCGFTPSDRARLGMAEVQRASKLDELISRRRGAG